MREYDAEAEKDTKDEGGRTERCEVRQKGMNTNTTRKGLTGRGRRVAVVGGADVVRGGGGGRGGIGNG